MRAHPVGQDTDGMQHLRKPAQYRICVRGQLGMTLLTAFPGLRADTRADETILSGPLPDQAALHGVLAQIEALGLELLGVCREDG
jgi:hypothetical protein